MNILLIIGNGFDLNLGLPTDYGHFYQYYLAPQVGADARIIGKELAGDLLNGSSNWADLEKQLGQISVKYNKAEAYIDDIDHISDELTRYMRAVDSLDIPHIEDIAQIVYHDLSRFTDYLDNAKRNDMNAFLQQRSDKGEIHLDVITFNYTSVFERIMECWSNLPVHGPIKEYTLCHIHQKLDEHGILLGVNDVSQIANAAFRNNYDVKATIVKPFINKDYESGIDKDCEKAIKQADIIILFGSSMGDTDLYWWNFIGDSMNGHPKRLVYCPYDRNPTAETKKILRINNRLVNFVLSRMSLDANGYVNVGSKILPLRENRLFDFRTPKDRMKANFAEAMARLGIRPEDTKSLSL